MWRIFLLVFLLISQNVNASGVPFKIDEKMAHRLVAQANDGNMESWSQYDYDKNMDPVFYTYDELGLNADSIGFFAVNPWTGDVWALWGCRKESTLAIRKLQARIKKRFTATEIRQYKLLSDLKPFCTFDWDDPDYK